MLKEKHCTEGFSWDNIEHVNVTCWRYGSFYSLLDNAPKYYVGTWVYYPKENVIWSYHKRSKKGSFFGLNYNFDITVLVIICIIGI